MKKSLLIEAVRMARCKLKTHPEYDNFIHYSFIVQDNKILEMGKNNKKTPPIHYGYKNRIRDASIGPKTHSEIDAWRKARGILEPGNFEVINVRLNKSGNLCISKPCTCCHIILSELGCSKFWYSSAVGFLTCE